MRMTAAAAAVEPTAKTIAGSVSQLPAVLFPFFFFFFFLSADLRTLWSSEIDMAVDTSGPPSSWIRSNSRSCSLGVGGGVCIGMAEGGSSLLMHSSSSLVVRHSILSGKRRMTHSSREWKLTGLASQCTIPASRHRSMSNAWGLAVHATTTGRDVGSGSISTIFCVVSNPFSFGIFISMKIMSKRLGKFSSSLRHSIPESAHWWCILSKSSIRLNTR
mmetsp:Transcript_69384/g.163141  ORF Transcript_69384/g.163141 Transcript_69384/m.163141 type:complete len:217 (-) Transcript_69384:360-1010(-)